jgi:hypothetical protein
MSVWCDHGGETWIKLDPVVELSKYILMIMKLGDRSLPELFLHQTDEATSKYTFLHRMFLWVRSKRTRRRLKASR